jgi:hypothetical protein
VLVGHNSNMKLRALIAATLLLFPCSLLAWGPDGHSIINRLAAQNLPDDVPGFLRSPSALDAIAYYSVEPDRWKALDQPELRATEGPEHVIYLEIADLAGPLPHKRYDFLRALAAAQARHPDLDLIPERVGLNPYAATEVYERLHSAFRDYRNAIKARQDTKPIEAEIVFYAGWLGHYVGDAAQPLHTSIQHDGWVGPNPKGYTTQPGLHSAFEHDFIHSAIQLGDVAPLVAASKPQPLENDIFDGYVAYLRQSNSLVEKVYQFQKGGALTGKGTAESRAFAAERLAAAAIELRNLIYTAWLSSTQPRPGSSGN